MIKLGGLIDLQPITEAEVFTATSKETGTTSVFKTKAARDAAIKAGTHEKRKGDKDGGQKDPTDTPKVNIFKKDKAAKGGDSSAGKSEPPKLSKDDDGEMSIAAANQTKFYLNKELDIDGVVDINSIGAIEYGIQGSEAHILIGDDEIGGKKFSVEFYKDDDDDGGDTYKSFDNSADAMAYAKELGKKLKGGAGDTPKSDSSEKAPRDDKNRIIVPDDVWEKGDKYNDDWYQKKFAWITSKEEQEFINNLIKKSGPQVVDKLSNDGEKLKAAIQKQIEKKKEESKKDLDNAYKAKDFESIVSSLKGKIDDQEYEEISDEMKALEVMQDEMQDLEDDGGNTYNEKMEIDSAVEDLQDRIKQALSAKKESSTKLKSMLPEGLLREGTRSQVGVIDRSGKIASAYVHFDGYPSNMKKGLKKHMKNEKDVLTLIKKGGARGIFDDKPIEYYNEKPSPIKGNMKTLSRYIKSADSRGGAEYVYLYNMKDKKWYYADTYEDNELKKLF